MRKFTKYLSDNSGAKGYCMYVSLKNFIHFLYIIVCFNCGWMTGLSISFHVKRQSLQNCIRCASNSTRPLTIALSSNGRVMPFHLVEEQEWDVRVELEVQLLH